MELSTPCPYIARLLRTQTRRRQCRNEPRRHLRRFGEELKLRQRLSALHDADALDHHTTRWPVFIVWHVHTSLHHNPHLFAPDECLANLHTANHIAADLHTSVVCPDHAPHNALNNNDHHPHRDTAITAASVYNDHDNKIGALHHNNIAARHAHDDH
jgi:hypothetical protein